MELVLNVEDLRTLRENGTLDKIFDSCTYQVPTCTCTPTPAATPEPAEEEEKPKKKTRKKAAEKTVKEEPKEEPIQEEPKEEPKEELDHVGYSFPQGAPIQEKPKNDDGFKPVEITHDDLVTAAMPLVKEGKQEDLAKLLATYGVEAIPHLSADQIESFAGDLKAMGAVI